MTKITDSDFFLPEIHVTEIQKELESGRTKPLLVTGICSTTYNRDDYVVKLYNGAEMTTASCCFELVAACIARELDILAPEPVLANLSNELLTVNRGQPYYQRLSNSLGINFGSRYYTQSYQQLTKGYLIPEYMLDQVSSIFAFDFLVSNTDRGANNKTNMLANGHNILIYDHELAFDFVRTEIFTFSRNTTPWLIRDNIDLPIITKHTFYEYLKEKSSVKQIDFRNFGEKLPKINGNFWSKLSQIVPSAWSGDNLDTIRNRIDSLIQNRDIFLGELNRVLS